MTVEEKKRRNQWYARMRYYKGGATVGMASACNELCKHLPLRVRGHHTSLRKTGEYWCKTCERAIRCSRCRCCGNLGRAEPRHRNRDYCKRIE